MAELHFWADFGMVPDRLVLRKDGFDAAFEAFRAKEREAGRKATHEAFCDEAFAKPLTCTECIRVRAEVEAAS